MQEVYKAINHLNRKLTSVFLSLGHSSDNFVEAYLDGHILFQAQVTVFKEGIIHILSQRQYELSSLMKQIF